MKPLCTVIAVFCTVLLAGAVCLAGPTHKDVRYSKQYERSVMDIWTAKTEKPAPLVVFFHGGGFRKGDKKYFAGNAMLKNYHGKGVAFASVNYPFLEHTGANNIKGIFGQTKLAIEYLIENAAELNIDPQCISVTGNSAGALISCYVGYGADLPIKSVFAVEQPLGTDMLTLPHMKRGGSPIMLYTKSPPGNRLHDPSNARKVAERCKQLGIKYAVYGSEKSGLPKVPKGAKVHDLAMKLFFESWQMAFPE